MTRATFAFNHRQLDAHTSVIALEGDLDIASAPKLKWVLVDELGAGHRRVVVDLSQVTFMDSTALAVFVGVKRSLSEDGILAFAGGGAAILKLLDVTRLDRSFDLFPTVDAALSNMQQKPLRHPERTDEAAMPVGENAQEIREGVGQEPDSSSGEGPIDARGSLTGDAAVVLGIAATAMPFASSTYGQAERWLRILRQYGDAGIALAALGFTDEPSERRSDHDPTNQLGRRTDRDPVAIVTRRARLIAEERGASAIRTSHVLAAVVQVYGEELERALAQHGVSSADLLQGLGLGSPGGGAE